MKTTNLRLSIPFLISALFYSSTLSAAVYNVPRITHVFSNDSGTVLIKWAGSPRPGPCPGENHGWVEIQASANTSLKALAYSIYFSGKPARIDTAGCSGTREIVKTLYSPGG